MKKIIRIDSNGLFVEDVLMQDNLEIPSDCIETPCPNGFYKPKWNGVEWIEGLTPEEINEIKSKPVPKTELEILKETVDMLVLASLEV